MKFFYLKRNTTLEESQTNRLGKMNTKITQIKKYVLGFPIKTLRTYKETYYRDYSYNDNQMFI